MLSDHHKQQLLAIAKQSIAHGLEKHQALSINPSDYDPELQLARASFVTLHINDNLRGCIGSLEARQALVEDIAYNAHAAAFSDPRFGALKAKEFPLLHYHISILSDSSAMNFVSEEDLIQQIRPNIDGLIIQERGHRGTFLPSVWEQLPNSVDFLQHLKQKAGLSSNYWSDSIQVSRYTVESFS